MDVDLRSVDDLPFSPDNGLRVSGFVAYVAPDGTVLFLRRGSGGDHAGEWSLPGGGVEDGESVREAAAREFHEETGSTVDPQALMLAAHHQDDASSAPTFVARGPRFDPVLDHENDLAAWASLSAPPQPLHPKLVAVMGQIMAATGSHSLGSIEWGPWVKADTVSTATGIVNYDQTSASRRPRKGAVPWKTNADLPDSVRNSLPSAAQDVFREVANRVMAGGASDESAMRQAWTAVKNGWKKKGDEWVKKLIEKAEQARDEHGSWTAGEAERVLHEQGHVTDIGQLSPKAKRHLDSLVGSGHSDKTKDYNYPNPKTRYELIKPLPGYEKTKLAKGADAMGEQISFFMPLTKKEPQADGSVIVTGYASTPTKDLDDEIISLDAVKKALPDYMSWRNIRAMHQPNAVGTAKEAHVDDVGLYLRARIVEPGAVHLVNEGVYQGFSIGGRKVAKVGDTVTELDLVEISIVDRPCNPDTRFAIAKSAGGSMAAVNPKRIDLVKVVEERPALFTAPIELEREEVGLLGRIIQKLSGGKLADQTIIDAKIAAGLLTPAEIAKRDVSDKERAALAEQGHAMNDGSYPIASVQDLQNAVQAFGRAKNKAAVKRHIIRRAKALKATDRLPADWSGSTKDGEMAGGGEKLAKAASLYTVSSMIELLGRLEYLEECCEGPAGFCCAVVGGGDGTVVECDKAFTDRFGALLVQFADMTAELLDMAVSQMKKEEADEAAAKLATALHRRRQKVAAKAARADDRAIRKAAKLICRTGMDLQKNWSDAAHQAATDARAKASDHRKAAVEHFGQQAAAEGRGATDEAQNHLMAGATHMEAARGFDRAASAIESDTNGAVSARAQHLSGKLAQKLAFAETSDMRQRILGKAAGKPTTLAIEELAGTRDDDGATGDVMSDLAMIAKAAQAGPRTAGADDPFAELKGRYRLN